MLTPRHYVCYRAPGALVLDGRLDKPFWHAAAWTQDFADIEGAVRPRPRFRTRVKMLWDDAYLYIGAEMEEPHVWATLTEHDSVIFHDNDFEVFIDPDGDNHDYYEIEINALNTTWDLRLVKPYRDGGPALNEWEIPGFRSAVHVDGTLNDASDADRGWSLEMALPWKALGEYAHCAAPPHERDQWRINFSRVEWDVDIREGKYHKIPDRPEHNWVWSPQGVVDMHRPETWGYVQFSACPPGSVAFKPDPSTPARDLLMQVYYAQKVYHKRNGRYAATLEALKEAASKEAGKESGSKEQGGFYVSETHHPGVPHPPSIHLTAEGFTATCVCRLPDGATQNWHVRQDSRLWTDAAP